MPSPQPTALWHTGFQRGAAPASCRRERLGHSEIQPMSIPPSHSPTPGPAGNRSGSRFLNSNARKPDNSYARQEDALRQAIFDVVTEDEIEAVATRLLEMAKEGDVEAARLLLLYTIGPPEQIPADSSDW